MFFSITLLHRQPSPSLKRKIRDIDPDLEMTPDDHMSSDLLTIIDYLLADYFVPPMDPLLCHQAQFFYLYRTQDDWTHLPTDIIPFICYQQDMTDQMDRQQLRRGPQIPHPSPRAQILSRMRNDPHYQRLRQAIPRRHPPRQRQAFQPIRHRIHYSGHRGG